MTHLYLIRHGEAVCNVTPIIGGMHGDTGLTLRGIQQVERLRDRLVASREIVADVFFSSTLPRARQTAGILAPAFNVPVQWDDDLQEILVGEADGLSYTEVHARYGKPDSGEPLRPIAPGGENWVQFVARVNATFERIVHQHHHKTIVIVCHGGIIDCSFGYFLGINTREPKRLEFYPDNASVTQWEVYNYRGIPFWRLKRYNDVAHLHTVGVEETLDWAGAADDEDAGRW